MTSKIVVNNIEADTGISTVTFNSNISGNFVGNVNTTGVSTFSNIRVTGGTISGVSTAGITTVYIGSINDGAISGARNRIINGDMRINQRNAGASVTPTSTTYGLDRWRMSAPVASKYSFQQNAGSVTPPVGFTSYLGVTSLSAYTIGAAETFVAHQYIEGYNTADLAWGTSNAKTVTLSFWVQSSLNGTFGGSIGNLNASRSYPFAYTINAANTWEYKTITIPGDTTGTWGTTTNIGMAVYMSFGTGSTYSGTAGAWAGAEYYSATGATSVVGTNGATFYITGVQLESGTVATPFERRSYADELRLCQRYFCKSSNPDVVATVGADYQTAGMFLSGNVNAYASNAGYLQTLSFPVTMRTVPSTITLIPTSLAGTSGQVTVYNAGGSAWTAANVTIQSSTATGFDATVIGTWSAGATLYYGAWTANAEL